MRPFPKFFRSLAASVALLVLQTACATTQASSSASPSASMSSVSASNGTSCPAGADWAPAPPMKADSLSDYQRSVETRQRNDWADLARYRGANAALGAPKP